MKWSGWGDEGTSFTHVDKPGLRPFIHRHLDVDIAHATSMPVGFDELAVDVPSLPAGLRDALERAVGADHVSTDALDRVVHARGKSLRDLVRQRRGELGRLPDVVVRPGSEADVGAVLEAALAADAVVIPFGGGSNISGGLEPPGGEPRSVISVDLGRLDRVLSIDAASRLAEVQAGAFGPDLEEQLNAQGWTLGHFPDSFAHSTLGGWIATRSSGMQSDKYGDIADLTRGLRVVTPAGLLVIRPVPSTSTGPSVREMVLGSEGRLGIVTAATVHVHRLPAQRVILGYLFPTWPASLAAMRDIAAGEASPSVTRVSDPEETQFSFATKKRSSVLERLKSKALMTFLTRRRGFDLESMCLAFIGYEGSERHVAAERRRVKRIVAGHGGLCIGSGPGALYDQKKFDTPYIRDFLLDRGVLADVSETAAPWSALAPLYRSVPSSAWPATSCATSRTPTTPAHACTSPSRCRPPGGASRSRSTASSRARSSRRSSTRGRRCRTTTRSGSSMRAGSSRTSRGRASRCCAGCSTASIREATSTPARSSHRCPLRLRPRTRRATMGR
jgi:alkyldihydroxyacetonephosphate synthase